MNKKSLIGIGLGAVAVGIFLLAVTNPNLRENKDTYFGFIDTKLTNSCLDLWNNDIGTYMINNDRIPSTKLDKFNEFAEDGCDTDVSWIPEDHPDFQRVHELWDAEYRK